MGLNEIIQQFKGELKTFPSSLFKPKETKIEAPLTRVACDLGHSKIIFLEVEKEGDNVKVLKFEKFVRPKENLAAFLKQTAEKCAFTTNKARISIKGQGVIIRFIQFPKMAPEELKNALIYEAEKYIPFKYDEVIVDSYILDEVKGASGNEQNVNLLLVAVKRDEIYPLVQPFQEAGFQVELIDVDALAMINALEFFHPDEMTNAVGVLDIGSELSTLSVIQDGKPRFIRDISYGGEDLLKRLKRKLGVSQEDAAKILEDNQKPSEEAVAVLKEGLESLVTEIRVSLDYYIDQVPAAESLKKLFLGGGGGYPPIVTDVLTAELGFPVQTVDFISKLQTAEGVSKELIQAHQGVLPVVMGLAVREL